MPTASATPAIACRPGCGACCIAPSIAAPLPGMPHGKPAGVRCVNLDENNLCRLWGTADYPDVCRRFTPTPEVCGSDRDQAMVRLTIIETDSRPEAP